MPIYTSSKGEEKDTANMPTTYLKNALKKAQEENNQANIDALEAELATRDDVTPDSTSSAS